MTLIYDVGSPYSTSMCSLEEADATIAKYHDSPTAWTSLSVAVKEILLTMAAHEMSRIFALRGYKAFKDQSMPFPRKDCQDKYGWEYDEMPEPAKEAQALIAYEICLRHWTGRPDITEATADIGLASLSSGGLSVSFKNEGVGSSSAEQEIISNSWSVIRSIMKPFATSIRAAVVKTRNQYTWDSSMTTTTTTSTTTTTTTTTSTTTTA